MKVIGAGLGRTGTYSLKAALERLGFGPCYHMESVLHDMPLRVPHWNDALAGRADWAALFEGFNSAVDWPTASFYRELSAALPDARFILSTRSPDSWAASYGSTIAKLVADRANAPEPMQAWLDMAHSVTARCAVHDNMSDAALAQAFMTHEASVKATIPAERLLVFEAKQGWAPLCDFLGVDVPDEPYPRTNDRSEFWELVEKGQ
ncbi:sulfotransferase family protein [Chromatocurvus halotolerans]|uniref:Sulfotransferase family protein n=1 Tax=Chromatocurvus halotolerans TaxID=1132028 RepID=A0A4R2KUX1_9GAMM|nr:sulfotransferase family protein [Chromatocurvus halotolerans]TCO77623.1 hypothetical protein EV688_10280 [Chromatocurvus halotolerans]